MKVVRKKLALITRTKNRPLLLNRALESVSKQTSNDFIHVILNDGGDKLALEELLKKYPSEDRVMIHNTKSAGLTRALNQAIRSVDTKYVAIMDDDDTILPTRIEKAIQYLESTDAIAVAHVMDRVVEEMTESEIRQLSREKWHDGVKTVSLYMQCLNNYLTNGCVTYRRDLYEKLGGYDENLEVAEDWDFGIKLLLESDVDFIDSEGPLSVYHHRPEQHGDNGNSVFAGMEHHRMALSRLRNKYLREDIRLGKIGVGYIMNQLAYTKEREDELEKLDLARVVRIEGHINHSTEKINEKLHKITDRLNESNIKNILRKATAKIKNKN